MRGSWCLVLVAACAPAESESAREAPLADPIAAARYAMVETQIVEHGVQDERVLAAMRNVLRHEFVPERSRSLAYRDTALRIDLEQTISQPYIVAIMTELAALGPDSKVLEIGTGSGYGAAVLAEVAKEVYTIEILEPLANRARATLYRLGYKNVSVRHGDGYRGCAAVRVILGHARKVRPDSHAGDNSASVLAAGAQ